MHAIHGPPLTFQLGVIGVYVAMVHRGVVGGVSAHASHDTSHGVWIVLSGIPASVTLIIMTDSDADILRLRDLAAFDAAIHTLYGDGLLSEQTMTWVWGVVHRESQEMLEIGGDQIV